LSISTNKQYYYKNEAITIKTLALYSNNTPIQNLTLLFSIKELGLNFNQSTDTNGLIEVNITDLNIGNYTLECEADINNITYKNITFFEVRSPIVSLDKETYLVNETINVRVLDYVGKIINITVVGPLTQTLSYKTKKEESLFSLFLYEPGNYSVKINEETFNIQVLSQSILLNLEMKENYILGEAIPIKIIGTENTEFNLKILNPFNTSILSFTAFTDKNGIFQYEASINFAGNYKLVISFSDKTIEKNFVIKEQEPEFKIYIEKKTISLQQPAEIKIFGKENTYFVLELKSDNSSYVFNLSTTDKGILEFYNFLEPGNYSVILYYNEKKQMEDWLEVLPFSEEKIAQIDRIFVCELCTNTTIPTSTEINVMLYSNFSYSKIIEHFPKEWIIESEDAKSHLTQESQLDYYNTNNISYSIKSPEIPGKYNFFTEFVYENSIVNQTWYVDVINYEESNAMKAQSYYFIDKDNTQIDLNENIVSNTSGIIISSVSNVTVNCLDNYIEAKEYGIKAVQSNNLRIENCVIKNAEIGIMLKNVRNAQISGNTITKNTQGIIVYNSSGIVLTNNKAIDNTYYGVLFYASEKPITENNIITSNSDIEILEKLKSEFSR